MWGAKTGAEGGALVTACEGLVGLLHRLGVAIDGGKDSLSMAARVGTHTVLAPGESRGAGGCGCRHRDGSWVTQVGPMGATTIMGHGCHGSGSCGYHRCDGSWVS